MRFRSNDGEWVVDHIRLSLTSDHRDGEWLRISHRGLHVADVRTVSELAEYLDIAELHETLNTGWQPPDRTGALAASPAACGPLPPLT